MFLEKNLNAMTEKMSFIKKRIEEEDYISDNIDCGTEEIAGRKILYVVKEGNLVQLDSLYNQEILLDKWFEKLELKYNSKVFMFGLGNGMFLRKMLEMTDEELTIYLYEPSINTLVYVLKEFDLSDILSSERVSIYIPEKENATKRLYDDLTKILTYSDVTGYVNFVYPNYNVIWTEEYMEYHRNLQELFDTLQANRLVYEKFGGSYFENSFVNFMHFCHGKNMNTIWPYLSNEIPAIIVSSGPSLTKNVNELKRAKGRAIIIAADSAVNALLIHDIIPDLFVCIDARKNPGHFTDARIKNIPMICMLSTSQAALKDHKAPCYFVNDGNPHILFFMEKNGVEYPALSCGGSVANTATSFAEVMGFNNIILVGQDLAYTNNKTHAEGSLRSSWNIDFHDDSFCYIEGQNGEMIESSTQFKVYRDWFERELIDHPELNLINATEGGALIHGAEHTTLKDAIDKYCQKEYDIDSIFANSGYLFDIESREELKDYMFGTADELVEIRGEIRQCISLYEKMESLVYEGKYHSQKFINYYKKSEEINKMLMSNQAVYYPECMMQKEVGEHLRKAYDTENDERKELLTAISNGKEYIDLIGKKIDEILPKMREYIDESKTQCDAMKSKTEYYKYTDNRIQSIRDKILNRITPNMTRNTLRNISSCLCKMIEISDSKEYGLFIDEMYDIVRALRPEMSYIIYMIYSFLIGKANLNTDVLINELGNIIASDEIMTDEQRKYLDTRLGNIKTCSAKKIYKEIFVNYDMFFNGTI